jgi:DUF1680 family protein
MNLLNADAKHADLIETILLNHLLGSTAQDGRAFFYRNALASAGDRKRNPWSDPACCATNVVRIFPQIGRFIYATSAEALYVDQFISSETELNVGGLGVGVRMQTDYPWDGRVSIELSPETRREFEVCIRIPAWVRGKPSGGVLYTAIGTESGTASVRVNGQTIGAPLMRNGYCAIRRMWNAGDTIVVDMPMPVQRVVADERVEENHDRTAIMRGPIVYCIEGVDHAVETGRLALHDDAELSDSPNTNLLGGVWTVSERGGALNAIPYYAWNNRGAGPMMVWVPRRR